MAETKKQINAASVADFLVDNGGLLQAQTVYVSSTVDSTRARQTQGLSMKSGRYDRMNVVALVETEHGH
jgi:hypothetical protein